MKTPERWRASCDMLSLSVFLPRSRQRMSRRQVVTYVRSWRHVTSHDVILHHKMDLCNLYRSHHQKVRKSPFSKSRPWPLTYDLWQTDGGQTHRQTGPILYPRPLTREGNIQSWKSDHATIMLTLFILHYLGLRPLPLSHLSETNFIHCFAKLTKWPASSARASPVTRRVTSLWY